MNKFVKRILSGILTAASVFAMSVPAFAAETPTPVTAVTLGSTYFLAGDTTNGVNPETTFTYTIERTSVTDAAAGITTANMPLPTFAAGNTLTFDAGSATSTGLTKDLTLNLPTYTGVGVYTYTISQTAGSIAGVAYDSHPVTMKVTVLNHTPTDGSDTQQFDCYVALRKDGVDEKINAANAFSNTYSDATLNVRKEVTGNCADKNREFDFTVTFTKPDGVTVDSTIKKTVAGVEDATTLTWTGNTATYNFKLKHGQTATFANLPYGVSYYVDEAAADGYTTTYTNQTKTAGEEGFLDTIEAVVTNAMGDVVVDTGVITDNGPWLALLGLLAIAGIGYFIIKGNSNKDDTEE